jgi:hypothetical protein
MPLWSGQKAPAKNRAGGAAARVVVVGIEPAIENHRWLIRCRSGGRLGSNDGSIGGVATIRPPCT